MNGTGLMFQLVWPYLDIHLHLGWVIALGAVVVLWDVLKLVRKHPGDRGGGR